MKELTTMLYAQGRTTPGMIVTNGRVPTFHSVKAGLAFDFCKNVKGEEYSDVGFFRECAAIAKELGFSWGGDWRSFPDMPHIQWDEGGRYTSAMILLGQYPPQMPQMEETMTQEQFNKMMENYLRELSQQPPAAWSAEARVWAESNGLIRGDESGNKQYRSFLTREQMVVLMQRLSEMLGKEK